MTHTPNSHVSLVGYQRSRSLSSYIYRSNIPTIVAHTHTRARQNDRYMMSMNIRNTQLEWKPLNNIIIKIVMIITIFVLFVTITPPSLRSWFMEREREFHPFWIVPHLAHTHTMCLLKLGIGFRLSLIGQIGPIGLNGLPRHNNFFFELFQKRRRFQFFNFQIRLLQGLI